MRVNDPQDPALRTRHGAKFTMMFRKVLTSERMEKHHREMDLRRRGIRQFLAATEVSFICGIMLNCLSAVFIDTYSECMIHREADVHTFTYIPERGFHAQEGSDRLPPVYTVV